MPELPEVETIRRGLDKFITKKTITKCDVLCDKSFIGAPPENATIKSIRRFGKALVIDLDNGESLLIHLRMTGQLIYDGDNKIATDSNAPLVHEGRFAAGHPSENFVATLPNKQTRVVIHFNTGTLYFNDQRKFGFIKVVPTDEIPNDSFIKKLAPEPWQMSPSDFYERLNHHPKSCIKATILDQTVICGLGNIYADEALFASSIHPMRHCDTLSKKEAELLLLSAREVMDKSIASGGSTMATYVKADGTRGDYLDLFARVFNKTGEPCPKCGTKIIKIKVAGRGTHICPHCQVLPSIAKGDHHD